MTCRRSKYSIVPDTRTARRRTGSGHRFQCISDGDRLATNLWRAEMRRREFIAGLGSAAAWPVVARARQPAVPVIGYLGTESPDVWTGRLRAFRQGLGQTGYNEGRNVTIEYRWAEGHNDRFPAL